MNVLIISRGLPTAKEPQWGCFEFDQAKALAQMGHHVIMVSVDSRFRFYWRKPGLQRGEKDGVLWYNFFLCPAAISSLFGKHCKELIIQYQWNKIKAALREQGEEIDVIYAHYLFNAYAAVRFLFDLNKPIIAIEHWSEINKATLRPNIQSMGEEVYPKLHRLITVSAAAQKAIKEHFNIDADVVNNMVGDTFRYTNIPKTDDVVRFVATGSLIHRKGFDILIKALAQCRLPQNRWTLTIIGHGTEKSALQKLIRQNGLENNILLVGHRTPNEMVNIYSHASVFILPSRMETFGVVYIEALACGLPVIATPCGGPEEFVTKKDGLLVPIEDVNALAQAIQYMYSHYQVYDRVEIATYCLQRFSAPVIAQKLTDIFEEVTSSTNKS